MRTPDGFYAAAAPRSAEPPLIKVRAACAGGVGWFIEKSLRKQYSGNSAALRRELLRGRRVERMAFKLEFIVLLLLLRVGRCWLGALLPLKLLQLYMIVWVARVWCWYNIAYSSLPTKLITLGNKIDCFLCSSNISTVLAKFLSAWF